MNDALHTALSIDGPPLVAALCASVACALLGNLLVLRRLSLMGDAISHAVLPGLVVAFLVSGLRSPGAMFVGAAIAGVATVVLVEVVRRLGRVEPGAAMGVVFSVLFAAGVLLLERASARHVDLDADCVLYGQLETLFWFPPQAWDAFWTWQTWSTLPLPVWTLVGTLALSVAFVVGFGKELRLSAFDAQLSTTLGFHAGGLHLLSMTLIAVACVASFVAVGSILVIAMLITPAATARLWTDRWTTQFVTSALWATAAVVLGYLAASAGPALWGGDAVHAAGSIAVTGGVLLGLSVIVAPRHGLLARARQRRHIERSVGVDDLVAALYRLAEHGTQSVAPDKLRALLPREALHRSLGRAARRGWLTTAPDVALTDAGAARGRDLVRRHRLWETYLATEVGVPADRVHPFAEHLEHLEVQPRSGPRVDPHGRAIPGEEPSPHDEAHPSGGTSEASADDG